MESERRDGPRETKGKGDGANPEPAEASRDHGPGDPRHPEPPSRVGGRSDARAVEGADVEAPDHSLPADLRAAAGRIVLQAIADIEEFLEHGLGALKVADLVRGSRSKPIESVGLRSLPTYGGLSMVARWWVDGLIEALLACGYVERVGHPRPILRLTKRGEQALFDRGELRIPEIDRSRGGG